MRVNIALVEPCLALRVVVVFTGLAGLVEALKESDYTEKLQHTLLGMVLGRTSFGHAFGRD